MKSHDADELPDGADRHGDSVKRDETSLLHHQITRAVIGGVYAVHSALGVGFVESAYANALSVVLRSAGLRVQREVPFEVRFRGVVVGTFRADLIVESKVVVETKALRRLEAGGLAQVRNQLGASGLHVGLLVNFGATAEHKRVILTPEYARPWRAPRLGDRTDSA